MASPALEVSEPRRGAWLLPLAALAIAALSLLLSFRLPLDAVGVSLPANGPRMLLAAAVGFGLAFSGAVARASGGRALRDAYLFALATGGAAGIALALKFLGGAAIAVVSGAVGALLFAGAIRAVDGRRRISNAGLAILLLAMLVAAVPVALMADSEREGFGGAARWLLGDFSRASVGGALSVAALALALAAFGTWRLRGDSAPLTHVGFEGRPELATASVLLLGLAIGAGGPIAFVGWFAPWLVSLASGASVPASRALWMGGALGAALLMAADAVPRELIGGYAPPVNIAVAVVAIPTFLWWNRRRLRAEADAPAGGAFEAFEAIAILLVAAALLAVAFLVTGFARGIA